jgi:hypothetical protein
MPFIQQPIDLATNRFPLLRALRLMRAYVPLEPGLLGTHQGTIQGSARRAPTDCPRISQIVGFERGSDLVEEIETVRRANGTQDVETLRQYGIDQRRGGEETRVAAQLLVEVGI